MNSHEFLWPHTTPDAPAANVIADVAFDIRPAFGAHHDPITDGGGERT